MKEISKMYLFQIKFFINHLSSGRYKLNASGDSYKIRKKYSQNFMFEEHLAL